MPDSLRDSESSDVSAVRRDSQIEELLLAGLDHYFSGQHELAISVWTRVLFLDRGHARARAYIERARGAIAERQREAEELLQTGMAAFQRGDAADAQRLLASAVERGVRPEEPLALLERLARLSPGADQPVPAGRARVERPRLDLAAPRSGRAVRFAIAVAVGLVAGALIVLYATTGSLTWPPPARTASGAHAAAPSDPLPVPSAAEVSLARAQAWAAAGRLPDALRALEAIRPGDPLRSQADTLEADIQQRLLAAVRAPAASSPGAARR